MRRFFAFVYCFSALAFAACDDNKGDSPEQWFRQPEVTVDGLTAEVTCLTLFGKGVLASNPCGFVCQPVSSVSTAPAITVTDPRIEDSMLKCTLTSLAPETVYMVYPFVDMNGERMTGKPAVFQTWEAPEEPDPDNPGPDEPKPDPDPDPDPDNPDPDQPTPPPAGQLSRVARAARQGFRCRSSLCDPHLPRLYVQRHARDRAAQLHRMLQLRYAHGHVVGLPAPRVL